MENKFEIFNPLDSNCTHQRQRSVCRNQPDYAS